MSTALTKAAPLKPEIRLAQAVSMFEADLTTEQKVALQSEKRRIRNAPPDIRDVMRLTAEIDRRATEKRSGGRCFGPRLVNILQAVQQFAALGDIVIGGSQNLLVRFSTYLEKLSALLMVAGRSAPRYDAMALLYPRSRRLQSYMLEYFLIIIQLCHELLRSTQKSIVGQLTSFLSETGLNKYRSDLDIWATSIKEEVNLLTAQQIEEQGRRLRALTLFSESELYRRKVEKYLQILNSCSKYDHQTPWKEIRRRGNTTLFLQTREYQDWRASNGSCTLLYTGKLGSGKSIMMANMVDDLNLHAQDGNLPVAYFFCQYDVPESLRSRTILGSIARQLLHTSATLSTVVEEFAELGPPMLDDEALIKLLRCSLSPNYRAFIIIDGLDECDGCQRIAVMHALQSLQGLLSLSICLSFRQEADYISKVSSETLVCPISISIPEDNPDITTYISDELERRLKSGQLILGNPQLILEIFEALSVGAQGMFLWVALQIDSLCMAKTDEAIRQALNDLPKDLPSTFARILQQSAPLGENSQKQTLQLIIAACRPLRTNELREALSITPGDPTWNPARVPNNIYSVLACCGSLVIVDEDTLSVKLIHSSVKQFLVDSPPGMTDQILTVQNANKMMIGLIATYLDYDAFKGQLITVETQKVQTESIVPTIIRSTLEASSIAQKIALKLLKASTQSSSSYGSSLTIGRTPYAFQPLSQYYFRDYAETFWLQHVLCELGPSTSGESGLFESDTEVSDDYLFQTALWAVRMGHETLLRLLLIKGVDIESEHGDGKTLLLEAVVTGHEAVIRLLINKGADIKSRDGWGHTPLSKAASAGHENIVKLLLEKGADVESRDRGGHTPLSTAVFSGCKGTAKLLIDQGTADIESKDNWGQTPLSIAASAGHEAIVKLLLKRGADVDSRDRDGHTPLSRLTTFPTYPGLTAVRRLLENRSNTKRALCGL